MPNYDEFKKKAKDAFETIADVSVEAYKIAEEKAKLFARRAKLTAEITREKSVIRKLKYEIGGTYYDLHKDDAEPDLKNSCDGITTALDNIAAKRAELEDLKRGSGNDEEAEEIEEVEEDVAAENEEEIPDQYT